MVGLLGFGVGCGLSVSRFRLVLLVFSMFEFWYMLSFWCEFVMLRLCIVSWLMWFSGLNIELLCSIDNCLGW